MSKEERRCHSCRFKTDKLNKYEHNAVNHKGTYYFCDVCNNSTSGIIAIYPSHYGRNGKIIQHITYCTNVLLKQSEQHYMELKETILEEFKLL
jgi:hypothetical protein